MSRFLLDTGPLAALLLDRPAATALVRPLLIRHEAETSMLVYGEVIEHIASQPDVRLHTEALQDLLVEVKPHNLMTTVMDRYAFLRRQIRPPYGPGLIGDIDTSIPATAMEHDLTLVTTDQDFERVPELRLMLLDRLTFRQISGDTTPE